MNQYQDYESMLEEYSRKNASTIYPDKRKRSTSGIRIGLAVLMVVLTLLVVGLLVLAAYAMTLQNKLSDNGQITQQLAQTLEKPKAPQDPFYMLLLGTDGRSWDKHYRSDTILLARVDPDNKKVTLISIPRDTPIKIEGHGTQKINAAYEFGGPKGAVEAVSDFAGVPITHYLEVDFNGFKDIVDAVGGVHIDVPVRINDKDAGNVVIEKGPQVLNGEEALTFTRSRKFIDGDFTRMRHQRMFIEALAKEITNNLNPAEAVSTLNSVSNMVKTDMRLSELIGLVNDFRGFKSENLYSATVPSEAETIHGVAYVVPDLEAWDEMMKKVRAGEDPSEGTLESSLEAAEKSNGARERMHITKLAENKETSIIIRNATNISGAATTMRNVVKEAGFQVNNYGDADKKGQTQTIIYYKPGSEDAARRISEGLSLGQIKEVTGNNSEPQFNADILVIIGTDWAKLD